MAKDIADQLARLTRAVLLRDGVIERRLIFLETVASTILQGEEFKTLQKMQQEAEESSKAVNELIREIGGTHG